MKIKKLHNRKYKYTKLHLCQLWNKVMEKKPLPENRNKTICEDMQDFMKLYNKQNKLLNIK